MKKTGFITIMLTTFLSSQNVFTADVAQGGVVVVGPAVNERTPLPADQAAELKTQLSSKDLRLGGS